MKKAELKEMLKPIIKDCIKEVIFEDGVLSGIISEVAQGLSSGTIVEQRTKHPTVVQEQTAPSPVKERLEENRKKILHAIGSDAYNGVDLFEGTNPEGMNAPKPGAIDLGTPGDAGVDISSIMGNASKIWQNMK